MQGRFRVSFTAAALRLVKRSNHSCALVLSKGDTVTWVVRSPEWRRYYIPSDTTPDDTTLTAALLRGEDVTSRRSRTPLACWCTDERVDDDAEIVEEVRRAHGDSVLTLLYDEHAE
jgi:hypothetical protein